MCRASSCAKRRLAAAPGCSGVCSKLLLAGDLPLDETVEAGFRAADSSANVRSSAPGVVPLLILSQSYQRNPRSTVPLFMGWPLIGKWLQTTVTKTLAKN